MTTKELLKNADKDLLKKFSECKTIDDAYAFVKEQGVTDSLDDFKAVAEEFRAMGTKLVASDASPETVSIEELQDAAGGNVSNYGWAAI